MATKTKTETTITCDVCGASETVLSYQTRTICATACATRNIGYLDEYGKFHSEKAKKTQNGILDLCPDCREKSYATIVGVTAQMFTTDCVYSFLEQEEDNDTKI